MSNPIKHRVYVWSMTTDRLYAWGTDRVDTQMVKNAIQYEDEGGNVVEETIHPLLNADRSPRVGIGGPIALNFIGTPIPTDNPAHRLAMAVLMGDMDAARILADAVLLGDITST